MRLDFISAPLPARSVLPLCCNAHARSCNGVGGCPVAHASGHIGMAGLGPAIHVFAACIKKDVDGRPRAFAGAGFANHDGMGAAEASDRGVAARVVNHHPIAIKAAAKELVCRSPEIQTKATIVELTEPLDDEFAVGIEVACPLSEGEEIAVAVVEDFQNVELCPGKPVEKVVQN